MTLKFPDKLVNGQFWERYPKDQEAFDNLVQKGILIHVHTKLHPIEVWTPVHLGNIESTHFTTMPLDNYAPGLPTPPDGYHWIKSNALPYCQVFLNVDKTGKFSESVFSAI